MNSKFLHWHLLAVRHINIQHLSFATSTSSLASYKHNNVLKEESVTSLNKPSRDLRALKANNEISANKFSKRPIKDGNAEFSKFISNDSKNSDTFGTLSHDWKIQQELAGLPEEEDDKIETEFLFNKQGKTRLTINKYGKLIKSFLKQKKIGNAIEVLETRMLKDDRVKPENYIYNLLIGACGQVGYTKKAFNLYKKMRDRGLEVTGHTYTGLFNSCANSPFPEEGLKRALHLRATMVERGVLMNQTIYHAMIKAFGRCGDLETAFMLVDEMLENKILVSAETFNFLLQACITDKTAGFRHALLVWWKMQQKRVRPCLFSFNLLLRCCRDCGLGDEAATHQVIQVLLQASQKSVPESISGPSASNTSSQLTVASPETVPNLICPQPTMGTVVAVKNITLPEDRLMLMGGSQGVLEQMKRFDVKPDIKTFTQLLDQLPSTLAAEQDLILSIKEAQVPMDVDFCNMLIKKRCLRRDYANAKRVLAIIQEENLRPDIMTFGVLAMTCQSASAAQEFLQEIDSIGFRPNVEILGTLLKNACFLRDCDFVMEMMTTLEKEELKPNDMFLKHLDNFYRYASKTLKQNTDDTGRLKQDRFEVFCEYYRAWRREMRPDVIPHPWSQFEEKHWEPEDIELMNYGKVKYAK